MATIGFHASHELYPPSALLEHLTHAERSGFGAAMCSDHIHPWMPHQGHSGYSFAWLGAALQRSSTSLGTICCPNGRYHPAVVAQAAATLEEMFPGRTWLALGTGEALNEHITGKDWPDHSQRKHRLRESADVIRALWGGEEVTHRGLVRVIGARLYSRPARPPLLFGAAISAETARWIGSWADGLLTLSSEPDNLRRTIEAFREGGGQDKPVYSQAAVAWDPDEGRALHAAHRNWRVAALGRDDIHDLTTPEEMDEATRTVRPEDLRDKLRISSSLGRHADWLARDLELGVERVYLHNVGGDPMRFIETFGARVLPQLSLSSIQREEPS